MELNNMANEVRDHLQSSKRKTISVPTDEYDHIELTDTEKAFALYVMRKEKYFHLKRMEYAEQLRSVDDQPGWIFNASQMKQFIVQKADRIPVRFTINEYNEELIEQLCLYFTGQPGQLDLNKGLLLFGNVGCGKTTTIKVFSENQKCSFVLRSCREVSREVLAAGNGKDTKGLSVDDIIKKYSTPGSSSHHGLDFKNNKELGICFDDLGTEDNIKSFGNQFNVMDDIISRCYDNKQMRGKIHITTNLRLKVNETPKNNSIEELYGSRVLSRIPEMFNLIVFPPSTPDYRTTK